MVGSGTSWWKLSPAAAASPFVFSPYRRQEAWRFLTYMLIHAGYRRSVLLMSKQTSCLTDLNRFIRNWVLNCSSSLVNMTYFQKVFNHLENITIECCETTDIVFISPHEFSQLRILSYRAAEVYVENGHLLQTLQV